MLAGGSASHAEWTSTRPTTSTGPIGGSDAASPSATTSTGAARSMMEATSPAPMRGLIPEVIAPSRSNAA